MGLKVVMAGGGTGGHVFPALAVAAELRRRDPGHEILFVGTANGIEARVVPQAGYRLATIPTAGWKGLGVGSKCHSAALLPRALWRSWEHLRRFRPQVVFGVGGYASGATMLVGALTGRPTVLFEPNVELGFTNRWLGPLVSRAAVAYAETAASFGWKAVHTGSPVREEFLRVPAKQHRVPFTLLIFGGSRGAPALNQAVLEALDPWQAAGLSLRFVHQTGEQDYEAVRGSYARRGILAQILPFIDDMAARFAEADLVISRAGASTVAELAAAGRAAILVPYPHATDQHQLRNAMLLARAGAALLIEQKLLTGERLAAVVVDLYRNPERLREMEARARRLAIPDAAGRIADLIGSVAA